MKNKFKAIIILLELIIIFTFLYTGMVKIFNFSNWIIKVKELDIANKNILILWFGYILPFLEVIVAILLLIKGTKFIASLISLFLIILLTIYIFLKLFVWQDGNCPCGGIFGFLTLDRHLIVNAIIFLNSVFLIYYHRKHKATQNQNSI